MLLCRIRRSNHVTNSTYATNIIDNDKCLPSPNISMHTSSSKRKSCHHGLAHLALNQHSFHFSPASTVSGISRVQCEHLLQRRVFVLDCELDGQQRCDSVLPVKVLRRLRRCWFFWSACSDSFASALEGEDGWK